MFLKALVLQKVRNKTARQSKITTHPLYRHMLRTPSPQLPRPINLSPPEYQETVHINQT